MGRTRMWSLRAVGSTIHSMIKFPTDQGVVTMETSRETLRERKYLERVQGSWKEVQWSQREEQMYRLREQVTLRTRSNSGRRSSSGPLSLEKTKRKEDVEEISIISHERSDQYDMYPFSEEGEELASLIGYPYKFFLQLLNEYNQIKMAEDDEEKTGFHMEEGVYRFTHMLKELKNFTATLQRMMEMVLANQKGRSVEIPLEEVSKGGKVPGHM
nr:reverse transcriptase domain-containing protein [Tanacetum cinerariifolium]